MRDFPLRFCFSMKRFRLERDSQLYTRTKKPLNLAQRGVLATLRCRCGDNHAFLPVSGFKCGVDLETRMCVLESAREPPRRGREARSGAQPSRVTHRLTIVFSA